MNHHLQSILNFIQQDESLSAEEKNSIAKSLKEVDKELEITAFKLERTGKLKKTTAILLEETIEELEQKRKAVEAQNRELEIEAALERVRAVAMGMKEPADMLEVCSIIAKELDKLGVKEIRNVQTAIFYEIKGTYMNYEYYAKHHKTIITETSYTNHKIHCAFADKMLKGKGEFFSTHINEAGLTDWIAYQKTTNVFIDTYLEEASSLNYYWYSLGSVALGISTYSPLAEEETNLFKRFRNVFELAYSRYTDIEKAEAQAREAQIQLALERVRARTMAMQKSEELLEVILVLSEQLKHLGFKFDNVTFGINSEGYDFQFWSAVPDQSYPDKIHIPYFDHPMMNRVRETKEKGLDFLTDIFNYEEKNKWLQHLFQNTIVKDIPEERKKYMLDSAGFARSVVFMNQIALVIGNYDAIPYSDEENAILKRFANVFEQSYIRFLDLKKAEAQARESQIQLALERVRARTMAMQRSDELSETAYILFQQFKDLGEDPIQITIGIFNEDEKVIQFSITGLDGSGSKIDQSFNMDIDEPSLLHKIYKAWKKQRRSSVLELAGKELLDWIAYRNKVAGKYNMASTKINADDRRFISAGFFSKGFISFSKSESIPQQTTEILERFAGVFDLTYTRFLDLQKAEAQTREAKIEAAMEKVRARAMAMQKPNELIEVAQLLSKEMGLLGVEELETSSIYIHDEASKETECWYAIKDVREKDTRLVADHMTINLNDTWVGNEMLKFYTSSLKQTSILMKGENRKEWINYCAQRSKIFEGYYGDVIPERTYHLAKFSSGYMGAASPGDISAESWELLKRATTVFSLAYTRFSDLQIAEVSAKEAIKQATLDRIRADIASMRTISDLDRITPLIWNELTILGVPFIRCGVFIMDDSHELIHTFLSTPEGKAIAAFHLPYTTPGNTTQVLSHWHNKKIYIDHCDEEAFTEIAGILVKQGAIASPEHYLNTLPRGGFYLHFLPFLQGMLYVGNTTQLGEEEIKLIHSIADAFSTAYARYEDFNKLEAAKQQVDKTLVDLKQAQQQLIQSEKMASLGELTAGIAHEIQNPLNFVNNFSEVNTELLDELKQEIDKGNFDDVKIIAKDLKDNEQKIIYHGKRADAIVKGMLQHSRVSTGQKEPTDINALADEYLRLSYHGLRAKDKSFNATLQTDFDASIRKINIVPQDIGRVLLNLFNNAFYAVNERHASTSSAGQPYEPIVSVCTKKVDSKIEIHVKDNGVGIPQKIIDKIFQPFFTTKPTGQGTGLGLSLSYDSIKAHGGEIKVESEEGDGSEFVIQLPIV